MLSSKTSSLSHPLSNPRTWGAYLLLLLLLGLAQFWDARLFPFFQDDFDYLDHIEAVQQDPTRLFSPEHNSSGRPSTTFFFMAIHALWGDQPVPYHLALIVAHILTVWILGWSLHQLGFTVPLAATTGILFLFNVTHYVIPYWPSCQSYLGCLAAGCLAAVAYCRFADTRQIKWYIGAILLLVGAATCHGGATGFAVLACYFAWRRGADLAWIARTAPAIVIPCVSLSLWFLVSFPRHSQMANVEHILEPLHILKTTLAYLGRTFLSPHWLPRAFVDGPGFFDVAVGAALVGLAVILALYRRGPALDALVFAGVVLPVFGGSSFDDYHPRYFYFSSVGPSILIAWALIGSGSFLSGYGTPLKWGFPAAALCGIIALSHFELDKSESVFWGYIGRSYLGGRDPEKGLEYLGRGLMGAPDDLDSAHYRLYGIHALFRGEDPRPTLQTGLERNRGATELMAILKIADLRRQWSPPSPAWIAEIEQGGPNTIQTAALAANNAGLDLASHGQYAHAQKLLSLSVQLVPGYTAALANLGSVLAYQNQTPEAMLVFERLYQVGNERDLPRAKAGLIKVVNRTPGDTRAWLFLAKANRTTGAYTSAVEAIAHGLEQGSRAEALLNEAAVLRSVLAALGDAERIAHLDAAIPHDAH